MKDRNTIKKSFFDDVSQYFSWNVAELECVLQFGEQSRIRALGCLSMVFTLYTMFVQYCHGKYCWSLYAALVSTTDRLIYLVFQCTHEPQYLMQVINLHWLWFSTVIIVMADKAKQPHGWKYSPNLANPQEKLNNNCYLVSARSHTQNRFSGWLTCLLHICHC